MSGSKKTKPQLIAESEKAQGENANLNDDVSPIPLGGKGYLAELLLANSPVCHKIVDLDLNLQYMNAPGFEMLQLEHSDNVYGKPYPFDFFPEAGRHQLEAALKKVVQTQQRADLEGLYCDSKGNGAWLSHLIVPVKDEKGSLISLAVVTTDITERNRAEEAHRQSEERLNLAMEATQDGLFDWDFVTNEIYYSPGWKSMLGYDCDELPNDLHVWEELTKPEDVKRAWAMQQELISRKRDRFELELKMKHKKGHWLDVLSRAKVVLGKDGQAARVVGTIVDITKRRNIERALRASEERLKLAAESGGLGLWEWRVDLDRAIVSDEWLKLKGLKREEYNRSVNQWIEGIHPDDKKQTMAKLRKVLQGESDHFEAEYRFMRQGHGWYWEQASAKLIERDPELNPIRMVGYHKDITKRKEINENLRKSGRLLQEAQAIAKVGSWEYDLQTNNFWASDEGFNIFGLKLSPSNLLYTDEIEACIPEKDRVHQALVDLINENKPYDLEYDIFPADGSNRKTIVSKAQIEHDDNGNPRRVTGVIMDVTEQVAMRDSILRSNERLKEAQRLGGLGDWEYDFASSKVSWSENLFRLFDLDPTQDPPDYPDQLELFQPESAKTLDAAVKRAIKDGEIYNLELKSDLANGKELVFLIRGVPDMDDNGNVTRLYGTALDITELKRIEQALRTSEKRFRSLLENVDMVAVQGYDEDRKVIYWNKASELMYGYSAEEAQGKALEELIVPEPMRKEVVDGINDWIKFGKAIPAGEIPLARKDGSTIPVYSSHVMKDGANGKKELYCIDVDLTEVREAHNQLIEAKEAAEDANRAKSEFLANMSHEIRTPLNGLMGMLQLLKTTSQNTEQSEFTEHAIQSSRRLLRLLTDILDLSRVEAGKMNVVMEPFDFKDAIDDIVQLFLPAAIEKQLELRMYINPDIPSTLSCDVTRLQQVLSNLVGNAIKFTNVGHIELQAHPLPPREDDEYRVLFAVSDTGIGMSDELVKRLFTPFTQAEQSYKRSFQGAGLGLSISKRLAELMGGTMVIESEEGIGSTLYFCIPFKLVEGNATVLPAEEKQSELEGFKILIAEDDATSQLVATKLLEKVGHEVVAVDNGEQALIALKEQVFDFVLMDVQMPVVDGVEATHALRQGEAGSLNKDIPIIAMTAYTMAGDKDKFLEAGMNGYIAKPVDIKTLQSVLGEVMENFGKLA